MAGSTLKNAGLACWLYQYKDPNLFRQHSIRSDYDDMISPLCNLVSDYWDGKVLVPDNTESEFYNPLNADISPFQCHPLHDFAYLFDKVLDYEHPSQAFLDRAAKWVTDYARAMRAISGDGDDANKMRQQVIRHFVDKAAQITNPQTKLKFAAAVHHILHRRLEDGKVSQSNASIGFNMFPEQYIQALSTAPQYQFRLWKHCDKAPSDMGEWVFVREIVSVRVELEPDTSSLYLVNLHNHQKIGRLIEDNSTKSTVLPLPQTEFVVEINSNISTKTNKVSYHQCRLVDVDELEF